MLIKRLCLLLALLALMCAPAGAMSREEVRQAYAAITETGASPYAEAPRVSAPYEAGELTGDARREALDFLNFARRLAGLTPVSESTIYNYQCQRGAALLAALDYVDHSAPKPRDMDQNFYDSAHLATTSGSIAKFSWMRPGILREGVEYFLRDDGEENLSNLGHRRWALNPAMGLTGFGLANSESGMSYVVMYAHDLSAIDAEWDSVPWPAPGAFPAELIHDHLAWSIMLNPERYDLAASDISIALTEETLGLRFDFRPAEGTGDGFCCVNYEGYGAGPCLVFRPDLAAAGIMDYQQNQRWHVQVDGLSGTDGAPRPIGYDVEMISLIPQDAVNVEISPLEAALVPGEALQLRADVIPAWADDLSVSWRSTDGAVAAVDDAGLVTAVAPGECEIVVACAGGYEDRCAVTVSQTE